MNRSVMTASSGSYHPKAVAPSRANDTGPAVATITSPTARSGSARWNGARTSQAPLPVPPKPTGNKGTSVRAPVGRTTTGFVRAPNGGAVPTDSRPGGLNSTAVQLRPQAIGRVGLNSRVVSADTAVNYGYADPPELKPGNASPSLPAQRTKATSFFFVQNKPQWAHIILTAIAVIVVIEVIRGGKGGSGPIPLPAV